MHKAKKIKNDEVNSDRLNPGRHFKRFTFVECYSLFKCNVCKAECKELLKLGAHSCGNRHKLHFTCEMCAMRFETPRDLYGHYEVHKNDDLYECYFCRNKFTCSDLKLHAFRNTSRVYQCKVCRIEFRRKCVFDKHMVSHTIKRLSHSKGVTTYSPRYLGHTSKASEELVTSKRRGYPRDIIFHSEAKGLEKNKKDTVISVYKNVIFQLEENAVIGTVSELSTDHSQNYFCNPLKIEIALEQFIPGNYPTTFSSFQKMEKGNSLLAIKRPSEEIDASNNQNIAIHDFRNRPNIIEITVSEPQLLVNQPEPREILSNLEVVAHSQIANQSVNQISEILFHPIVGVHCSHDSSYQPQQTALSYIQVQLPPQVPCSSYIESIKNQSKQRSNIPALLFQPSVEYQVECNEINSTHAPFSPHNYQLIENLPYQITNIVPNLQIHPSTGADYSENIISQSQYNDNRNAQNFPNYAQTAKSHPHPESSIIPGTLNHPSSHPSCLGDIECMLQQSALNSAEVTILSSDPQRTENPTDQDTKVIQTYPYHSSHLQTTESYVKQNTLSRSRYTCLSPYNHLAKQTEKRTRMGSSQQHNSFVASSSLKDEYLPINNSLNSIDADFLLPMPQYENQNMTDEGAVNVLSG